MIFVGQLDYMTGYNLEWASGNKSYSLFLLIYASYLFILCRNLIIECWKVFKSLPFGIKVSFAMMEGGS